MAYHLAMRKPNVAKPRTASAAFSLSRKLPRLNLPNSAPPPSRPMPRPTVGKPGRTVVEPVEPVSAAAEADACTRCGHGEAFHPVRYVCDKYPHPDPLQICGCESETLDEVCGHCGHSARAHKPRHRCRIGPSCLCWGYQQP